MIRALLFTIWLTACSHTSSSYRFVAEGCDKIVIEETAEGQEGQLVPQLVPFD